MRNVAFWRELRIIGAMIPAVLAAFTCVAAPIAFYFDAPRLGLIIGGIALVLVAGTMLLIGRLPVVLYLRRFGDESVSSRFGGSLTEHLISYFRIVALADPVTNPIVETAPRLAGCVLGYLIAGAPLFVLQMLTGIEKLPLATRMAFLFAIVIPLGTKLGKKLTARLRRRVSSSIATSSDLDIVEARARRMRAFSWKNYAVFRTIDKIGVTDALWRETVVRLARHADAILVDASVAGPSLVWEIGILRETHPERLVIIAAETPADPMLREVLHGHVVLLDGARFRKNLRGAIWTASAHGGASMSGK